MSAPIGNNKSSNKSTHRASPLPLPLAIKPLTALAFAPYGDVISTDAATQRFLINQGRTERFHQLAGVRTDPKGSVIISIFRGQPSSLPLTIAMMERHPLGSQAFMPLERRAFLVVVGQEIGKQSDPVEYADHAEHPDQKNQPEIALQAFYAQGDQGVNYHPGVWHHPLIALGAVSDFLVVDRYGEGNNCEEITLRQEWVVDSLPQIL